MKKVFALLTVVGFLTFGASNFALAQDNEQVNEATTEQVAPEQTEAVEAAPADVEAAPVAEEVAPATETPEEATFTEVMKKQFIDGGWQWMSVILLVLVLGLAVSIERIIYLALSTSNTKELLVKFEKVLNNGGVEKAKDLCRDTKGPVAGIFFQGLLRYNDGLEEVEKSLASYGAVMVGNLESGTSWITLFIALGPSIGFMGTVVGMIQAFDDIAAAGDISPTIVAGGMKVALLTTVFGLITAVILQICFNIIINKIESIVSDMEESSISFMDILTKYNRK